MSTWVPIFAFWMIAMVKPSPGSALPGHAVERAYAPSEEMDGYDVGFSREQGFTFQKFESGHQSLVYSAIA